MWPHWSYLQRKTPLAPLWRDSVLPETTTGGDGRAGAGGALAASAVLRLHHCHTVILQNTDAPTTKRQVTLTAVTVWGLAVLSEHVLCAGHATGIQSLQPTTSEYRFLFRKQEQNHRVNLICPKPHR